MQLVLSRGANADKNAVAIKLGEAARRKLKGAVPVPVASEFHLQLQRWRRQLGVCACVGAGVHCAGVGAGVHCACAGAGSIE